jgi:hypothetical protein
VRIFIVFLLIEIISSPALAQTKEFDEIQYPAGMGILAFTDTVIVPHSDKLIATPIHYGELNFSMLEQIPQRNLEYMFKKNSFRPEEMRKKFSGASVNLMQNTITTKEETFSPWDGNNRNRFAIALANFDYGIGIIVSVPSIDSKMYFSPTSQNYLREYTMSGDRKFHDKTYLELTKSQQTITDPDYYIALLNIAIKGDFSLAAELTPYEKTILIDTLGISIAEKYVLYRKLYDARYFFSTSYGWLPVGVSKGRILLPVFNALLIQFYNHGGLQITLDHKINLLPGKMKRFYDNSGYMPQIRLDNEKIITKYYKMRYPLEFSAFSQKIGNRYNDNIFDMMGYLFDNPKLYDDEMQLYLRKFIIALSKETPLINNVLVDYYHNH